MKKLSAWFCLLSTVLCPLFASAQAPQLINYQGRLLNGTNLVNGNVGLSLRLFNVSSGGTSIYEDSNTVTVADGLYSTFIGDDTTSFSLLDALTNEQVFVEVAVNGVALSPRERLVSVGYSLSTRGILATTNSSFVFNPTENSVDPLAPYSTISGGNQNSIQLNADLSFLGGGYRNFIASPQSVIVGGQSNSVQNNADLSFLGGGSRNSIQKSAYHSFLGGGLQNSIQTNADFSFLGGGQGNSIGVDADYSFVGGGLQNSIQTNADYSFLGSGSGNRIGVDAFWSFLGGGFQNSIRDGAFRSFLGGGYQNSVGGTAGTVPGGEGNAAVSYSFAAGRRAKATNDGSFVWADSTDADFGTSANNQFLIRASGGVGIGTKTPGARLHVATGASGVAPLGGSVAAFESGSHTYIGLLSPASGESGLLFANTNNNADGGVIYNSGVTTRGLQFRTSNNAVRMVITSTGNVGIGTETPTNKLHVVGNIQASGNVLGQSFVSTSDRNAKQDIAPVDAAAILEKISALPVATWSFKTEPDVKHIGPMAQDFRAAFGLGPNDTSIATVDADGVALAAIQALHSEVRGQKAEVSKIKKLEEENAALRAQLDEVLQRLRALEAK